MQQKSTKQKSLSSIKKPVSKKVVAKRTIRKFESLDKKLLLVRKHRKTLCFNDIEKKVIDNYCKRFKITNKAKFFREAIIALILQRSEENYPTLF